MRVFITGATGFIGKYLVLGLANQGHEVHALARPAASTKALEAAGIRIFPGDLLDTGSVLEAMRACQHVYHLAGFARAWHRDRKTFHRVNVTGTSHVLDAASSLGVLKATIERETGRERGG